MNRTAWAGLVLLIVMAALTGCASARPPAPPENGGPSGEGPAAGNGGAEGGAFERDREAILAMTGDYRVTFEFRETVSFAEGYEPDEPFRTGGREIVRIVEDAGDTIRLQHILVVGGEEKQAIKHWRQDWIYEPEQVLVFIGGNTWTRRPVAEREAEGKWAQIVYQVDDSPRYGAVAAWSHDHGVSEWEAPAEWRPLPRRDATTRSDYHAIDAVNRHAITPFGWVHEQDNSKLVLTGGEPRLLVREVGVNTYRRSDEVEAGVAEAYWAETAEFWAAVRGEWSRIASASDTFGLTIRGEPEPLYEPLLELADRVAKGEIGTTEAIRDARRVIDDFTTTELGTLDGRFEGGGARPGPYSGEPPAGSS